MEYSTTIFGHQLMSRVFFLICTKIMCTKTQQLTEKGSKNNKRKVLLRLSTGGDIFFLYPLSFFHLTFSLFLATSRHLLSVNLDRVFAVYRPLCERNIGGHLQKVRSVSFSSASAPHLPVSAAVPPLLRRLPKMIHHFPIQPQSPQHLEPLTKKAT